MTRTTKEGKEVRILKQYRNQSNNYINEERRIYADLFKVEYSNGVSEILCETELCL